jgi:hypothetical protein
MERFLLSKDNACRLSFVPRVDFELVSETPVHAATSNWPKCAENAMQV